MGDLAHRHPGRSAGLPVIRCPACTHPLDNHRTEFGYYRCRDKDPMPLQGGRVSPYRNCNCTWEPSEDFAYTDDLSDLVSQRTGTLVRSLNGDLWIKNFDGSWSCIQDDMSGRYALPGAPPWEIAIFAEGKEEQ